jgi:hypothetical protein
MGRLLSALAAFSFSVFVLPAASHIDDPKNFVSDVYRPDDIYTARLGKFFRDDKRRAKGEVGCLDFDFCVNAQDWKITDLTITSADEGQERETVIAMFMNIGKPQEIHFYFRRNGGRWLLDDVHSIVGPAVDVIRDLAVRALTNPLR